MDKKNGVFLNKKKTEEGRGVGVWVNFLLIIY